MSTTVAFPQAGEKAHLVLSAPAIEALAEEYGEKFIYTTLSKLNYSDPKAIKLCLSHMLVDSKAEFAELLDKMTLSELSIAIADAVHVGWKGTKLSEIIEEGEDDEAKE